MLLLRRSKPGLEVIKLEFILKLKPKHNDWLLANMSPQAANHCALYEFETLLNFYNLEASEKLVSGYIPKNLYLISI